MWQHFTVELMLSIYSIIMDKLDWNRQQSETMLSFRNSLLKTGWLIPKPIYKIHNPTGLALLNRLRLRPSHLNHHEFNHSFRDCVNPLCSCSLEIESPFDFFLLFCTVIISQISRKRSLINYCQLMKILWINQKMKLWNYFSLVIKSLNSNRTVVSSIRFIIKSEIIALVTDSGRLETSKAIYILFYWTGFSLKWSQFTVSWYIALTYFRPIIHLYTPGKYQKTRGFLMFSGGIWT